MTAEPASGKSPPGVAGEAAPGPASESAPEGAPESAPEGAPGALPRALLIIGPTCSGKSALALGLARRLGGTVINADSMQVYRELRVLTARPTPEEEAEVPHALYGLRPASEPGSVAWWRRAALAAMAAARGAGRVPILCGGTGLYLAALVAGLADIPDPGPAARGEARTLLQSLGAAGLHARLASADPASAAGLLPTDGQRIARAWEVLAGTGRGLAAWQALGRAAAPWRFAAIQLDPPRPLLRAAIADRIGAMLAAGALDEVRALLALGLDPALPAMRAHGVPEFAAHLRGTLPLAAAIERTLRVTGQYTKRQATWFRHHELVAPSLAYTIHARFAGDEKFLESSAAFSANFLHC